MTAIFIEASCAYIRHSFLHRSCCCALSVVSHSHFLHFWYNVFSRDITYIHCICGVHSNSNDHNKAKDKNEECKKKNKNVLKRYILLFLLL